jgi:hypothetical protein
MQLFRRIFLPPHFRDEQADANVIFFTWPYGLHSL